MTEAERAATGLTEAQRELVVRMGSPSLPYGGIATFNLQLYELAPLRTPGLCRCEHQPGSYSPIERLTPLGLAVRDILRAKEAGHGEG